MTASEPSHEGAVERAEQVLRAEQALRDLFPYKNPDEDQLAWARRYERARIAVPHVIRDLLAHVAQLTRERDAARERAEAIANTGHKPDCGGMDPAARECACGWLQAVDAHSYIKGLEAERDATRAEAAALRQERDAAREERDEMAGKARSYRTLLAEAEAKQRINEEQCDRMTSEAGRLAVELAEAEAAIRALADMVVPKVRLEHGEDCEQWANDFLEYAVGEHFPAVQRARQKKKEGT